MQALTFRLRKRIEKKERIRSLLSNQLSMHSHQYRSSQEIRVPAYCNQLTTDHNGKPIFARNPKDNTKVINSKFKIVRLNKRNKKKDA